MSRDKDVASSERYSVTEEPVTVSEGLLSGSGTRGDGGRIFAGFSKPFIDSAALNIFESLQITFGTQLSDTLKPLVKGISGSSLRVTESLLSSGLPQAVSLFGQNTNDLIGPTILRAFEGITEQFTRLNEHLSKFYDLEKIKLWPQQFFFPENLIEVYSEAPEDLLHFVRSEAIGIFGTPRASVVLRLLRAESHSERRRVLNSCQKQIVMDCRGQLSSGRIRSAFPEAAFLLEAIDAIEDGHATAAQALLTVTLDSLIRKLITDKSERGEITNQKENILLSVDESAEDENVIRQALAWLPIWNAHAPFYLWKGDEVPRDFSRHATVHAVGKRQYSKRNCIQVLLLVSSLLVYASTAQKEYWGILD